MTNRTAPARKGKAPAGGKVQLIDATSFWVPMRKSLGDNRREIPLERSQDILRILAGFKDGDTVAIDLAESGEELAIAVRKKPEPALTGSEAE